MFVCRRNQQAVENILAIPLRICEHIQYAVVTIADFTELQRKTTVRRSDDTGRKALRLPRRLIHWCDKQRYLHTCLTTWSAGNKKAAHADIADAPLVMCLGVQAHKLGFQM